MKSVTQSQNVCPARYGDPVDIFSCNVFFSSNPMCSTKKNVSEIFLFLNRHISRDKRFPFQCVRFRHFAKAFALQNLGKMTKRNSFHCIFWLQLPDVAKYCRGYVWMVLDPRNASQMRFGHILSIANIIQVLWTRITSTKEHFQGSGQMLRNTLLYVSTKWSGSDKRTRQSSVSLPSGAVITAVTKLMASVSLLSDAVVTKGPPLSLPQ